MNKKIEAAGAGGDIIAYNGKEKQAYQVSFKYYNINIYTRLLSHVCQSGYITINENIKAHLGLPHSVISLTVFHFLSFLVVLLY